MSCIRTEPNANEVNLNNLMYKDEIYIDNSISLIGDISDLKRKSKSLESIHVIHSSKLINNTDRKKESNKLDSYSNKQTSMEIGLQKRRNYDLLLNKEKGNYSHTIHIHDPKQDPRGPYQVQKNVKLLLQTWGSVSAVAPDFFLSQLLESRGYENLHINSLAQRNIRTPSVHQIESYDNELVWAIRNSNLPQLKVLWESGKNMSACNKFSESIIHMACRRADLDVVEFILTHGGNLDIIDDYGRTPLHDACWRIEPRFDIVTMILDINIDLIRFADKRGSIPVHYVRQEHWMQWCAYFYHQREKYWPRVEPNQNKDSFDINSETCYTSNNCSSSTTSSNQTSLSTSFAEESTKRLKRDDSNT